jgi:hypothetical protein
MCFAGGTLMPLGFPQLRRGAERGHEGMVFAGLIRQCPSYDAIFIDDVRLTLRT